jgi:hypothetical protein
MDADATTTLKVLEVLPLVFCHTLVCCTNRTMVGTTIVTALGKVELLFEQHLGQSKLFGIKVFN